MFKGLNTLYVALVVLLVLGLGVWGYSLCPAGVPDCTLPPLEERLALATKFFVRAGAVMPANPPWQLVVAQYVAPFVLPFVALLATLRIAILNMRRDVRMAMARSKRRHFIVCGLGETGAQAVQNLCDKAKDVVVIDQNPDSPQAAGVERQGVPVLRGDAAEIAVLRQAGLPRARAVILCTGEDAVNVDIALRIRGSKALRRRRQPLTVLVELRDEWLFNRIIQHDREALGTAQVDLRPFNIYENAARLLIRMIRPQGALEPTVRPILLFGFGRLGSEILMHLVRAAPVPLDRPTRITVFDREAGARGARFRDTTPIAPDLAAIEFMDTTLDTGTPEAWQEVERRLATEAPLAVVICLPDDGNTLHLALELRSRLDRHGRLEVPVFVRLQRHQRLGALAGEIERIEPYRDRLRVFGALEELLATDILFGWRLDALARAYHEHYLKGRSADPDQPGLRGWELLPEQFRASNRRAADHAAVKLQQTGLEIARTENPRPLEFDAEERERLAQLEHRRWCIERRLLGWSHGAQRDDVRRLNPYLVGWASLPEAVRAQNREAIAALPRILADAGFEIRPAGGLQ